MIFGYLILLVAVLISAIAAYYSVVGLTAIFAAAVMPVIIMGGALEAGKITATVWLHNNWARISWAYKTYLIPAIVLLMLLTSIKLLKTLNKKIMKSLLGIGLIILGVVSFFRYLSNYGVFSFPEFMGVLIGVGIFIIPGILLIRSENNNKKD